MSRRKIRSYRRGEGLVFMSGTDVIAEDVNSYLGGTGSSMHNLCGFKVIGYSGVVKFTFHWVETEVGGDGLCHYELRRNGVAFTGIVNMNGSGNAEHDVAVDTGDTVEIWVATAGNSNVITISEMKISGFLVGHAATFYGI